MKAISKRQLFGLCVSAFFSTMYVYADTYNLTFNIKDFEIVQKDSVVSITPLKSSYTFDGNSSLPALPYFTQQILIEGKCKPETFTFDIEEKVLIASDIYVSPNQESIPVDENIELSVPLMIRPQYSETIYPDITVKYVYGITDREGKEHSYLVASPFEYDTERNCLYFIPSIRVSYDSQPISPLYSQTRTSNNKTVKYLIITADSLVDAYKPMRDWKRLKTIETEIVSTETIYSTYSGNSLQEKIKRCLSDYYYNHGVKWVLLGGDDTIVPVRKCYIHSTDGGISYTTTTPSDAYYANFEGAFDWNADNDNYYGEISDNVSLTPHINVSRLPIRTIKDVEQYVEKLVAYERGDNFGPWLGNMLLSASKIDTYLNSGRSDAHYVTETMSKYYLEHAFSDLQIHAFYDTGNNLGYTGNDSILNRENLLRTLNDINPHYVHTCTHGQNNLWELASGTFQINHVKEIINSGHPMIITTVACKSNDFTCPIDPGLSEAFIREKDSGALAFWGSTHNGFLSYSTELCQNFWEYVGTMLGSFTDAIAYSKGNFISGASSYSHKRSLLLSMNAIGDSELRIFRPNPERITDVDVLITPSNVSVNSTYRTASLTIISKDDGGESLYYQDICSGSVESSSPLSICLSQNSHNYIPFYVETGRYVLADDKYTLHLQNLNHINGNISYTSDYTRIGETVDEEQVTGNVEIKEGACLNIESAYSTILDKGFKCEKGGKLIIR